MPDAVSDALESVAAWAGRPVTATTIKGGLSHRIARVETDDGERWLLRVLDPRIAETGLGIPLDQEIANTVRASATGVGAQVLHQMPGAVVLEYIDGPTMDAPAVRDSIREIARACLVLHEGPRFVNEFSIFRKLDQLIGVCRANDLILPDGYADCVRHAREIEEALDKRPLPSMPCHNDLLPENFIASPSGIRIVDYQLSGNNDPRFELGDLAAEADFDPDQAARLSYEYFGHGAHAADIRLYLIMSNLAWTLWFVIHDGLIGSGGTFDYSAEAADKFAQAVRDLSAPDFGRLIDGRTSPRH